MTTTTDETQALRRDERGRAIAEDSYPIGGLATIAEAEVASGLSRSKLYQMIQRGELETRRFGRACRITWASIRTNFLQ